jgi:hypothetical protein
MSRKINLIVISKGKGENEMQSAFNEKKNDSVIWPIKDLHRLIFYMDVRIIP